MSDMKCPFCQQEMESVFQLAGAGGLVEEAYLLCSKCNIRGERKLWQELIRTKELFEIESSEHELCHDAMVKRTEEVNQIRKALDVAVDVLKEIDKTRSVANHKIGTQDKTLNAGIIFCWATPDEIHNALEQITALEQKE